MKFPFLKTNNTLSHPSEKEKNVLSSQIRNYLQNELNPIPEYVSIEYIFTTTHGRCGDKFAAKLGEYGDTVLYFVNKNKNYHIEGKMKKLKCKESEIIQILTAKIEMAVKYNCVLFEWKMVAEEKTHS